MLGRKKKAAETRISQPTQPTKPVSQSSIFPPICQFIYYMDAVHYAVIVCRSDNNIMIGVRAREKFLLHQQQQHARTEREDAARRPCNLLARFAFESQLNLWSANQNLACSRLHFIQVVWELNQGHEICLDNIFFSCRVLEILCCARAAFCKSLFID
jgi:hypothetical protein